MLSDLSEFDKLRSLLAELKLSPGSDAVSRKIVDQWKWVWPTVSVGFTVNSGIDFNDSPHHGVLSCMGYRVGSTGVGNVVVRRMLLDIVFLMDISGLSFTPKYISAWGSPDSSSRLQKMAESMAAFCRNAKRQPNQNSYRTAIGHWVADLDYLKSEYYEPRKYKGNFVFPVYKSETNINYSQEILKLRGSRLSENCIPWLVDNSSLTIKQISMASALDEDYVRLYFDDWATCPSARPSVIIIDPIAAGMLTKAEITRCEADPNAELWISSSSLFTTAI